MGDIIQFPRPVVAAVQLSAYPQDDGGKLYVIETLNTDDTWDILGSVKDLAEGWGLAGSHAIRLGVPLLPKSTFPGRAA